MPDRPPRLSSASPISMIPACEMVEKASSRFTWRCDSAITPPSSVLATPSPSSSVCTTWAIGGEAAKMVKNSLASPNSPSDTMAPEKITETGLGATPCASGSQKWNGTCAPLISSPLASRAKAAAITGSSGAWATPTPSAVMSSAPSRA